MKERLTKNIKYLIENSKEVIVITENKNLEDELIRSLPNVNSHKKLFEHFSCNTKDGYKKRLAQMPEERLSKKLEKLVFTKFWSEKVLESYTLSDTINVVNKTLMDVHKN